MKKSIKKINQSSTEKRDVVSLKDAKIDRFKKETLMLTTLPYIVIILIVSSLFSVYYLVKSDTQNVNILGTVFGSLISCFVYRLLGMLSVIVKSKFPIKTRNENTEENNT